MGRKKDCWNTCVQVYWRVQINGVEHRALIHSAQHYKYCKQGGMFQVLQRVLYMWLCWFELMFLNWTELMIVDRFRVVRSGKRLNSVLLIIHEILTEFRVEIRKKNNFISNYENEKNVCTYILIPFFHYQLSFIDFLMFSTKRLIFIYCSRIKLSSWSKLDHKMLMKYNLLFKNYYSGHK